VQGLWEQEKRTLLGKLNKTEEVCAHSERKRGGER
jgi:hypothetical protein